MQGIHVAVLASGSNNGRLGEPPETLLDYLLFVQQWPPGTCAVSSKASLLHPTNHLHVAGVTVYTHVVNGFMHPVLG